MDLRFVKPVPKRQFPFRAVVAVSMALPLVASIALVRSEALHSWTAALLESAPAVQHRKAVIAAREKRFDESFSLFEQALAGGGAATIWVDYAGALSSAGRSADVLRLWPRMPASARSHQKGNPSIPRGSSAAPVTAHRPQRGRCQGRAAPSEARGALTRGGRAEAIPHLRTVRGFTH
jgi:hypothetical protein